MGSVATRIARVSPFAFHRTISFSRLPTGRQVSIVPTFTATHFQLEMLFGSTVRIRIVGSNAACTSPSRLRTVSRHPLHSARNFGVGTRGVAEIFAGRRNSSVPRCVIPAAWVRMIFWSRSRPPEVTGFRIPMSENAGVIRPQSMSRRLLRFTHEQKHAKSGKSSIEHASGSPRLPMQRHRVSVS